MTEKTFLKVGGKEEEEEVRMTTQEITKLLSLWVPLSQDSQGQPGRWNFHN